LFGQHPQAPEELLVSKFVERPEVEVPQRRAIASAATSPTTPIVLACWRQDRRAGNGILIEGSPSGEMHHAVIRLVDSQAVHLLNVGAGCPASMSRMDRQLPRLMRTRQASQTALCTPCTRISPSGLPSRAISSSPRSAVFLLQPRPWPKCHRVTQSVCGETHFRIGCCSVLR